MQHGGYKSRRISLGLAIFQHFNNMKINNSKYLTKRNVETATSITDWCSLSANLMLSCREFCLGTFR